LVQTLTAAFSSNTGNQIDGINHGSPHHLIGMLAEPASYGTYQYGRVGSERIQNTFNVLSLARMVG